MPTKSSFKRICVECNRNFSTDRPDARYCSSACRRAHFQGRRGQPQPSQLGSMPKTNRSRRP